MTISLQIGLDAINNYKRLAYKPWYALAEFVDNSTQSYFDNAAALDESYKKAMEGRLTVRIVYDKDTEILRISDNASGMSLEELERSLHVARPPENTSGRSKYGMGMKTAACWIGNHWTITTKKLGESVEHTVTVEVDKIAAGNGVLPYTSVAGRDPALHYTIIEIRKHNKRFQGRTVGKIRDFLRSMYREDFRQNRLQLEWNGDPLQWQELDDRLLKDREGATYKKDFSFTVDGKPVRGWVGILDSGSRADAGFSIIHCGRVVRGWPEAWRPESVFGQMQGTNDLVNQRLVGEIHLDDFEVSHTKDDILWLGDQEDKVQEELRTHCGDYRDIAQKRRKGKEDERGPSEAEMDAALNEFKKEIASPELVDRIQVDVVLPQVAVDQTKKALEEAVSGRTPSFSADIGTLSIRGHLVSDGSPSDPYIVVDSTKSDTVLIIINLLHPHVGHLKGSDGFLNYLRHCTYDAVAEWKARHKASTLDPDTIKMLKDQLLRVPFDIEMHAPQQEEPEQSSLI